MVKKCLILSFFLLSGLSLLMAGTTGKIAGKITDAQTGEPLPGANVFVEGTTLGAATDTEGDYFILNVPPGTYSVASTMMGYAKLRQSLVRVSIDRTIKVDFKMKIQAVTGEEVTIVSERDIVQLDMSASQISFAAEQIYEVPLVVDIRQFINLQAGIEGDLIRGGGLDQQGLVVDGLTFLDNQTNAPMLIVNLSAVEEVSVIKGGFNAEYGNIRSGLINITTKSGTQRYHGSVDVRYTPSEQKHRGPSLFSHDNFYLRPYLDPGVAFVGTANGDWDEYTQAQNEEFGGWNAFVADNPDLGLTAEQARDLFIWQHRAEGSAELGHPFPGEYGNKPDYNVDLSFGGPIPFFGNNLGDMTFFASHRVNVERPIIALQRDRDYTRNSMFKLTSNISSNIKFGLEVLIGKFESAGGRDVSGGLVLNQDLVGSDAVDDSPGFFTSNERGIYFPFGDSPITQDRRIFGLTFDHVLNPKTFYSVRVSFVNKENDQNGVETLQRLGLFRPGFEPGVSNADIIRSFGSQAVDAAPYGFSGSGGYQYALAGGAVIGGIGGGSRNLNKVNTLNAKIDLTSQITKRNEVQVGIMLNYDDLDVLEGAWGSGDPTGDQRIEYKEQAVRIGAYVQDKLEFEGMIANIGLRLDYNQPNANNFLGDPFSPFFSGVFLKPIVEDRKAIFEENVPSESAKSRVKISPRLGVSHPITDVSKIYFNYGHFYSMPLSSNLYAVNFGRAGSGILEVGNPSAEIPRTIAYELGYEHEIADMFLISLTGYYKDITNQTAGINFVNFDGSVNYETLNNSNYADVRGLEVSLEKRWGSWITGWVNYNYLIETNGSIGREFFFQDQRRQRNEGLRDPKQEKPLARPSARANIQLRSPDNWGPALGGIKPLEDVTVDLLFQYKSGNYFTWEPIGPFTVENNLQWKSTYDWDLRIGKRVTIGRRDFTFFADIFNVFNTKRMSGGGFRNTQVDMRNYLNSLHLPIYEEQKYQDAGFTAGDDQVGDMRSADKSYIDMPDNLSFAFNAPRVVVFGFRASF